MAQKLLVDRIVELEKARRNLALLGHAHTETLAEYARHHLIEKEQAAFSDRWLTQAQKHLQRAVDHFGAEKAVASIDVKAVQSYTQWLSKLESPRGGTLKPGTVRAHLNSLSNLYVRAQSESVVAPGFNPVASMMDKPRPDTGEADWFEVHDAALILEGARRYRPSAVAAQLGPVHTDVVYPLVACFLLTGGRKEEILGLLARDVSFDRKIVTFRPNEIRGLKTRNASRTVPLFPQLEEILRPYVFGRDAPLAEDALLFSSARTGGKISGVDKVLDRIAEIAGFQKGELRLKKFRHTFCAARLQTLDNGAPISPFTVARELGHGGTSLVERVYGHLGTVRHRSEHLEYRIENHQDELSERLKVQGW